VQIYSNFKTLTWLAELCLTATDWVIWSASEQPEENLQPEINHTTLQEVLRLLLWQMAPILSVFLAPNCLAKCK